MDKTKKNDQKKKVMIIESSYFRRKVITNILNSDPNILITSFVESSEKAFDKIKVSRPDIILIAERLPKCDGFTLSEKIIFDYSIPTILVKSSSNMLNSIEFKNRFKESGALFAIASPPEENSKNYASYVKKLKGLVVSLSKTKMITRHRSTNKKNTRSKNIKNELPEDKSTPIKKDRTIDLVAIGVSTGGPTLLQKILSKIPDNFPIPILIVQHISNEFDNVLISYLNNFCKVNIKLAENGETIRPSTVYFAPGDTDMVLIGKNKLQIKRLENGKVLHPSVSSFFTSVLKFHKENVLAIILTGMGEDGAIELKKLKDVGALTVAQESESCTVFGMPRAAIKLGAAKKVLTPKEIVELLLSLVS